MGVCVAGAAHQCRLSSDIRNWSSGDGEDTLLEPIGRNTAPAVQPLSKRSHAER